MATQVVTGENRTEFMAARMAKTPPKEEAKEVAVEKAAEAPPEAAKEAPKESEVKDGERIRLKTERQKAREEAEQAKAELEKLRKELAEARKPVESTKAKPDPQRYTDMAKYAEDLADWKVDQKLAEREKADFEAKSKAEADRILRAWQVKVRQAQKEINDYAEVVADANIPLTTELRDAILESEIGPRIQYYLAKNPEEVERLTAMTVKGMERAFGKLEAKIEAELENVQTKAEISLPKPPVKPRAEPPAPITPIGTSGNAGAESVVDANGNVIGDYAAYKAARKSGKLK